MTDKFPVIFSKVLRAKKRIEDVQTALQVFLDSRPYVIRYEDDPNLKKRHFYLASAQSVPIEIVSIVGDALHNLRSGLDYLAYQLVSTAGSTPDYKSAFPIANSATAYMTRRFREKIECMRQDAINAIDAVKPYKGGNDVLWRLHELESIDKHRLLLTACSTLDACSMTSGERAELERIFKGSHPGEPVPELRGTLKGVAPFPLNVGSKLLTVPYSELEEFEVVRFHFDVAFNEPGIVDHKPIVDALHEMAKVVGKIILDFDPLLA